MTKQRSLHLAIEKLEAGTKAARLRVLMPEIEQRLAAGTRIADVVQVLNTNGLPISTATLKSYLYRFRKAAKEDMPLGMPARLKEESPDATHSGPSFASDEGMATTAIADAPTTPGLLRHINTARCLRRR